MIYFRKYLLVTFLSLLMTNMLAAQQNEGTADSSEKVEKSKSKKKKRKKYKLPEIDLSHWKVTIPVGKPTEVGPPEILDYANNQELKPFMYNDSTSGAIVFYAYPNTSTANSSYSRSELREQMVPGDNSVNWTFAQGGRMKGRLAMDEVTKDKNGNYHKVIVMQIHGRLTNEQRDLIGQKDNNAPPMLKIYWQDGKVRVKTKVLKDPGLSGNDLLHEEAWTDDEGYTFKQEVGFRPFTLEVNVEPGKMVVSLNNQEFAVYDDVSIKKWEIFENYFKAGNYFQTKDKDAHAAVKYFELEVSH
ncbi:polysaccharide lyase family 7 protein [Namhaeicola litoreus]|uniref:Polysaccharide lyase family 7 protein n=1 Tax=Namhaeicola litoreus TaxID=1052145 RepID=A0ABW3Y1M2_9FLAO